MNGFENLDIPGADHENAARVQRMLKELYLTTQPLVSGAGNIAFSTSVPLTSITGAVMPQQTIGGALAFAPAASPAMLGQCYVRLVADGSNVPTFPGFTEHGSSSGFLNTLGIVNAVTFWYDGNTAWYSVAQEANPTPVATPVIQTAVIPMGAPETLVLTYSTALDAGSVPAASAYTITNSGGADVVTGVAVSGTTVTLTKSRTTVSADNVTLAYAVPGTGPLRSTGGVNAAALTSQAVSNSLNQQLIRLTRQSSNTESGNGTTGWIYTGPAGLGSTAANASHKAAGAASAGALGSASLRAVVSGVSSQLPGLGLRLSNGSPDTYDTHAIAIYNDVGVYKAINNGAGNQTINGAVIAGADGHVVKLERQAGSAVWKAYVSTDSEATWTLIHTFAYQPTADLYPACFGGVVGPIKATGMV